MGSSGTDVKDMQKKLIALGYSCGSSGADGSFGQEHIMPFAIFRETMA